MRLLKAARLTWFDAILTAAVLAIGGHSLLGASKTRSAADVLLAQAACREARVQVTLADGIEGLLKANPQIPDIADQFAKAGLRRERAKALLADACPDEAGALRAATRSAKRD